MPISQSINQRRHISRPKSIIDIHYADVRGAGIHHSEQSSETFESGAVPNAGGNRDHWDADQASDYAGQSAFHPGTDDDDARLGQCVAMRQQAMDAGYSDVVDVLDRISHEFRCDYGLFRYGDIAGPGGDYGDYSFAVVLAVALEDDGAGQRPEFGSVDSGCYGGVLLFGGPGRKDVAAMLGEAAEDAGYLFWSLALAEDHFGHAVAEGAVVVDLGEPQIFEGQVSEAVDGFVGRELLLFDLVEQFA